MHMHMHTDGYNILLPTLGSMSNDLLLYFKTEHLSEVMTFVFKSRS